MKKDVIVSLADANYYPLLVELIDSIRQFKQSENSYVKQFRTGNLQGPMQPEDS